MRKAFTLIELLVVIAIIAILAAILFPVFAQAKTAAKMTTGTSNLKQIALGLQMYSQEFDDVAAYHYGTAYQRTDTWVGDIYPYVKNRSVFFDPLKGEPKGDDFKDPFFAGLVYKWQWITHYAINVDGYSVKYTGTSCNTMRFDAGETARNLASLEDPASRLAVTAIRYETLEFAWMRFYGSDASWPLVDRYASRASGNPWDWKQLVFDARREYKTGNFIGAYADGHAGKFGKEKFVARYGDNPSQSEARSFAQYCTAMERNNRWAFWGKPWSDE